MLHMKDVDTMHMYAARKIVRKTSEKTLNLKGEMYFATETSLGAILQLIVVKPATATMEPGRISVRMLRRLIAPTVFAPLSE